MGTVSILPHGFYDFSGGCVEKEFDVTGSTAYANSGGTNTGESIGTQDILDRLLGRYYGGYTNPFTLVQMFTAEPRPDGYTLALDKTNSKFVIRVAAGTEGTAGSDMSTKTWRCRIRYFDFSPFFET